MGVPKVARMSLSATFTIVMSIIAINAAVITTIVMPSFDPVTSSRLMLSSFDPRALSSARLDRGGGAHARPQLELRARVQPDQHRHALHDLGEVAGGVVRRQQREARARATCQAVDVARQLLIIGVDVHARALAGPHLGDLVLLEVGDD